MGFSLASRSVVQTPVYRYGIPTRSGLSVPSLARIRNIRLCSSSSTESNQGIASSNSSGTITTVSPQSPRDRHDDFPEWAYNQKDKPFFRYEIIHQSAISQARVGRIHTPHGIIDTPGFVAVATNAALKGVDFRTADQAGQQLIFANTYHLMIHPGSDIVREAGGIHAWTNRRNQPFITDSGGFQVFSLAYGSVHEELSSKGELKRTGGKKKKQAGKHSDMVKVSEEGVVFRSYRDGSRFLLTPESTVASQKDIGADIIIPLDELPPYHVDRDRLVDSVDRTHRWETRSLKEHLKNVQNQAMYSVIHGGIDRELRTKSIDYLTSLPFDGYAIGGSLGNGRQELKELLTWMMPLFDQTPHRRSKPRHLLGIADEESIRNAVVHGIDTMDSCYPTRIARHGTLLVRNKDDPSKPGTSIKIRNQENARAFGVKIDDECQCTTCQHYDRAYLWHLFKANEPIAATLAAQHNIHYMNDLMLRLRQDIMEDRI
ncbi:Queuine tRNA-ribosyltransferase [Seminavis robusta]|uniref:Queuine tRNA-ribosyltransferase n=1 Tax=Seminavis robusta TaxID=568900 RepID=A0A9N8HZ76_9STRA|nr:Queuine tRNA-ribosyltransferase [Seminavis robusta]|eukprot:Sro2193_g318460.1 Queuine tRNA-ribosyltransferase (487) ;mRNA; r:4137-5687